MKGLARFVAVILVALFATGSVVQTASAAVMDLNMAMAAADAMEMTDCEECGTGGGGDPASICDPSCATPTFAMLAIDAAICQHVSSVSRDAPGDYSLLGRTGPPDPYPPRTLDLS